MGGGGPRYDLAVLGFAVLCSVGTGGVPADAQNYQNNLVGAPSPVNAPYINNAVPAPAGLTPTNNAPSFRVSTGVTVGESYNDNVNLRPEGSARSDYITSIQPNFSAVDQGARVNFGLTYDPQFLYYAAGTESSRVQQNLLGAGTAEIYPETLFVDANASIDQEFLSSSGPIGPSTQAVNGNLQTVQTYGVSPYLRHHFGPYADSESRYRFTSVTVGGNTTAPVQINEARQTLTSGVDFGRLGWKLTGDSTWYDRGEASGDSLSNSSAADKYARADLNYLIYEGWSALGGIGYETLHDPTLVEQPKGVIWDMGLQYQPAPYARASFTYGRRFSRTDYEFHGEYDIGPSLKVLSSYTQSYQTGLTLVAANGNQLTLNQNGQLVNSVTGLPVTSNPSGVTTTSPFGISNQAFIDKRFQTTVLATRGRNSYSVTGFEDRQSGAATGIAFSSNNSNAITDGGTVNWGRQLWRNLSSNLAGTYSEISFEDGSGRKDTLYVISAGLTYTFSSTLNGHLNFSRFSRQSNIAIDSLDNDILMVSLQKQF